MTKCLPRDLTLFIFSLYLFLLSFISFLSSKIFAEDTGTSRIEMKEAAQSIETLSTDKEKHSGDMKVVLAEGISTKAIWFGFEQEVPLQQDMKPR